jgi:HemY protein
VKGLIFRVLLVALVTGAIVLGAYALFKQMSDVGYLIVGFGSWSLETSLVVAAITLLIAFLLFYLLLRSLILTLRLPKTLKQRGAAKRVQRSQDALIVGLVESAQGNWERAEKTLIRHAANSGVPLVHYLTAARAAAQRGASELRDEYLNIAAESMPDAELAIGLTRAELLLSENQFEEALNNLSHLNRIAPSHAAVLKLLHRTYAQLGDWESLHALIPVLKSGKVLMEAEIRLLETETYSALLKQKAQSRDAETLKDLWSYIPKHVRKTVAVQTLYFAAMIEAGAGAEIESELRAALFAQWEQTLVVLYGCIELAGKAAAGQLEFAQVWLKSHSTDPILLRVLGKLCIRNLLDEKAEKYLKESLRIESSVEAFHLLGDLYSRRGDKERASDAYRQGLLLASSEVVKQVEQNPEGEAQPELSGAAEED